MRFRRVFLKIFLVMLLLGMITVPLALVVFGLESAPLVIPEKRLAIEDVKRIKEMVEKHNPHEMKEGEIKRFSITERDMNLLLYYALSHSPFAEKLNSRIRLSPNLAKILFTYNLPANPFGRYLNISAELRQSSGNIPISLRKVKIGALSIPDWLFNPVWQYVHGYLEQYGWYHGIVEGIQAIENVQIKKDSILLVYKWQSKMAVKLQRRGKDFLLPIEERKRLLAYNRRLKSLSRTAVEQNISLAKFFHPLFRMAKERTISGGDPIAENRALILTLAIYCLGRDLDRIVDRPRRVRNLSISGENNRDKSVGKKSIERDRQLRYVKLTLLGRHDLAQHFLVSAAITASAGGGMANFLGLFKEMDDSRGGSGFSFADLTADRAGVKFAELATGSPFSANLLHRKMSEPLEESDFMPTVMHLPEGIMELEFKKIYGDLNSVTYHMVEEEIERRIAECRIYQ